MKKYIFYTVQWLTVVILLTFSSCETIEIPGKPASEYEKIYMPTAVNYPNEKGLAFSDSVQLITYGAYFGSYDELGSDIEVQFEINADAAQSFNQQNNTDYPMLPEGLYTYSSASKIKKGEVSTEPLAIEINPGNELEESEKYILPVTVKSLSEGFVVNDELKTTYFVFSVKAEDEPEDPEDDINDTINWENPDLDLYSLALYSRSRWQFVEASSEAPEEGETNGGLGSHAIDGNSLSFWHSQWAGGEVAGPHYLIFDLGATVTLHGLSFIGRQSDNDGKPEEVVVSISNDYGQTWEDIDTLYLDNINAEQRFLLDDFKECNYIKITINTQHGGVVYSHLAEIAAF